MATLIAFWQRSKWAGGLLVPHLAWVSFAAVLNVAIWRMNAGRFLCRLPLERPHQAANIRLHFDLIHRQSLDLLRHVPNRRQMIPLHVRPPMLQ